MLVSGLGLCPTDRPGFWQEAPASVRLAGGLLNLQAAIWALLAVALAYGDTSVALTHPSKVRTTAFVVTVLLALAAGTFAAGKFRLAYRLPRGTHKTRDAVIAVEVMGGFAALILLALLLSVFGLILSPPIIIGGITSVWVANGLTKPPARWYFDASEAAQSRPPDLGPCHGSATRLNSVLV